MTAPTATAAPARRHAVFHRLRIAAVERLTSDAVAVSFEVPGHLRSDYAFQAGQHLTVRLNREGQELRRTYSICASPTSGMLRIAVKHLPGGAFSSYAVTRLQPGDLVEVMTPTGRFGAVLASSAAGRAGSYAAIAAGSGITPVLSIVATVLDSRPDARMTLVYANRTAADVMFLEELADLKDRHPTRFRLLHVLSREPQEAELLSGRLDADRLDRILSSLVPPDSIEEWFLCGPFAVVEAARGALQRRGVRPAHVHSELFHVDGEVPRGTAAADLSGAPDAASSTVTVLLDGRSSTFPLRRGGQRILDAVLAVRADAPYACKGGVCGTCRARLVEGKVRMERNYALEQEELAAGMVLACQSHPLTDRVVLDFDA